MARSWYVYMGYGDPTQSSNYRRMSIKHTCLCGNQICAIYAEGDGSEPAGHISLNLQQYIKNALATGSLQPELPASAKKYVYLRYR